MRNHRNTARKGCVGKDPIVPWNFRTKKGQVSRVPLRSSQ